LKQIRKRITYANVMSSIAVFLVLGGGAAYAAKKIGSNEIKAKAVTTGKIKKEAVTTSKIKKDAVTGAKVKESSLGQVPSALNATNATNATNASSVNGLHLSKIFFKSGPDTPNTTIFSAGGLTLNATCNGENLELTGTTSVNDSEIYESGNYLNTFDGGFDDDFDVGDTEPVGEEMGDESQDEVQGQVVYSTPAGSVVTIQLFLNDFGSFGETTTCAVVGIASFS